MNVAAGVRSLCGRGTLMQEYARRLFEGSACGVPWLYGEDAIGGRLIFRCGKSYPMSLTGRFDEQLREAKECHDGWHSQY